MNSWPLPQESIESGLLAAMGQSTGNWLTVQNAGIRAEDFVAQREVFLFMQSYLVEYGNLPSPGLISTRFNWQPPIGDFAYWLKEMQRYKLARGVLEVIQEGFKKITEPGQALNYMLENLSLIRSESTNHISAYDSSAETRYDKYLLRQEYIYNSNEIIGLPTGIKVIDDTKVGWTPGSLVGLYSRPGVGKTWFEIWQGAIAWINGKRVLAITPEMPAKLLELRVDTVVGALVNLPIDYGKLIIGHPDVQENYQKITEILASSQRFWIYDSIEDRAIGLGDLTALIRQHQPDIVLIDGVSLLRSDTRGQTWEQMKDICYGLKNIATIHEVPIIITHQAVNSARGRRTEVQTVGRGDDFIMPSLNDAAYGDAFVAACSDVITMVGDSTTRYVTWYSIRKHRERGWQQALPARLALATDFATGRIIDLSERGYNPEVIGQEAMRLLGMNRLS